MEDALKPTRYCDYGRPDIVVKAADLKADGHDPVKVAGRCFYFVRDRIVFGIDLYERKASETLRRGYGSCWNKALLLIALLRCNRIPARLGTLALKRTFIRPATGPWHWLINNPYHHCRVHARLGGRWVILDPVLDRRTFDAFFRPADVDWRIDWNGEDDVRLYTESEVGPPRMHTDIDAALDNKAGNQELPRLLAMAANRHLNRRMWKRTGGIVAKEDSHPAGADRHPAPGG